MIHIAICDDNEADRETLARYLEGYLNRSGWEYRLSRFSDGGSLYAEYADGEASFDLVFLDIFMPGKLGIEVAKMIRAYSLKVKLIFVTSTMDFALESYDVFASGYVVKPIDVNKLHVLLEHLFKEEFVHPQKYLLMKYGGKYERILLKDIVSIESKARELIVTLSDQSIRRYYGKLDEAEQEIGLDYFLRCHKSYLVNMHYIKSVDRNFMTSIGKIIPIRQNGAKEIKNCYMEHMMKNSF